MNDTLINISVDMEELASSTCHAVGPEALIAGTIWPDLDAVALSDGGSFSDLTLVLGTILKDNLVNESKARFTAQVS